MSLLIVVSINLFASILPKGLSVDIWTEKFPLSNSFKISLFLAQKARNSGLLSSDCNLACFIQNSKKTVSYCLYVKIPSPCSCWIEKVEKNLDYILEAPPKLRKVTDFGKGMLENYKMGSKLLKLWNCKNLLWLKKIINVFKSLVHCVSNLLDFRIQIRFERSFETLHTNFCRSLQVYCRIVFR